jgi:uncharacterized protein (DUF427 family)
VEGNHYFPPDNLVAAYFKPNQRQTVCPWKGVASYYDIIVEGEINRAAAWTYPDPSTAASEIRDHVAFWNGVKVRPVDSGDATASSGILARWLNLRRG